MATQIDIDPPNDKIGFGADGAVSLGDAINRLKDLFADAIGDSAQALELKALILTIATSVNLTGLVGVGRTPVKNLDVTGEIRASTGVLFGTDTVAANTLDDYEEGTWTPTLSVSTPGNLTVGYSAQQGTYTRVGRLVSIQCRISLSSWTQTTASGNLKLEGLPFAGIAGIEPTNGIGNFSNYNLDAGYTSMCCINAASQSYLEISESGDNVAVSPINETQMSGNEGIQLTLTYSTS